MRRPTILLTARSREPETVAYLLLALLTAGRPGHRVAYLMALLGCSKPTLYRRFALLTRAGWALRVERDTDEDGTWVCYSLETRQKMPKKPK